jgi:hypothetical protein
MTDFDKCQSVINDAISGSSSIAVRHIAAMLTALAMRHGAQFTIDGAVQALDDIVKYAQVFKEELTKQEETILMPYRIARSITNAGKTYVFVRMEGGQALYALSDSPPATQAIEQPMNTKEKKGQKKFDSDQTIDRKDLPPGAVLSSDFVGGKWIHNGRAYRMMQPITKCNGMYVFLPSN